LPDALLESELFGYVRGAFTGAIKDKVGRFEVADGGSIFLDEISELSFELQAKLLRVLQDREITRIGSNLSKTVDFRVIIATNCNLRNEVKEGRFRKDLFFRLNVFPIELPPLRMRVDDLSELVDYSIKRFSFSFRKSFQGITKKSMDILSSYSWPGNIRELENVLERACILTPNGGTINISPSMLSFQGQEIESDLKPFEQVERDYLIKVLRFSNGKIEGKGGASEILEIHPNTLRSRLKKLGVTIKKFPDQIQNNEKLIGPYKANFEF
jgi:transcriptional regulator with GAF, ATPase, and Fis domain